jgi:hypothetical protein
MIKSMYSTDKAQINHLVVAAFFTDFLETSVLSITPTAIATNIAGDISSCGYPRNISLRSSDHNSSLAKANACLVHTTNDEVNFVSI